VTPLVIDGSALAEVLVRSERAPAVESLFEGRDLCAPDVINAEVLSVVRSLLMRGLIALEDAHGAVTNLARAPLRRMTTAALVPAMWRMHHNVTPYDASYVALALRLDAPLLTLDGRLARAPGLDVKVLTA
jgi:predicted nucleic acid-binding protein